MLDKEIVAAKMNVVDEDSMDSISYIFPDNVTPFVNQVAGHEFTKAKPTIGINLVTRSVPSLLVLRNDVADGESIPRNFIFKALL